MAEKRRSQMRRWKHMIRLGGLVFLLAAASVLAEPSDVLDSAGSVAKGEAPEATEISTGSGTVSSQTGAFQYSYPIAVPPGRNGAQPALALSYSSQSSLWGGIASGWSVQLPVIERHYGGTESYQSSRWVSSLAGGRELVATTSEPGAGSYRAQGDASFARYQFDGTWRVLQTDGSTLYFGELAYVGGTGLYDWMPLTRVVDAFGNEVRYSWEPVIDSVTTEILELRIKHIEYSENPGASLLPHAFVDFDYGAPTYCNGSMSLPVGAKLSYRSENKRTNGYAPLASVTTTVADGAGTRQVRRYDLAYDPIPYDSMTETCTGSTVPRRLLTSITETATSPEDVAISLPPVTFAYGAEAARGPGGTPVQPIVGEHFLPTGIRAGNNQSDLAHDNNLLLDIDGDGLIDWLQSSHYSGLSCGLEYYKNDGKDASGLISWSGPHSVELPSILWESFGGGAQGDEHCSLNGQFSLYRDPNSQVLSGTYQGARLLYKFRDYDGDGIVDLLTGLSGVASQLDPNGVGNSFGYRGGLCPQIFENGAWNNSDGPAWETPSELFPGGVQPPREPIGVGSGNSLTCFGWKFYRNVPDGTGRKFELDKKLNSPTPIYSAARGAPSTPPVGGEYVGNPQLLIDLDGDGSLDFLRKRKRSTTPSVEPEWFWYRQQQGLPELTGAYIWMSHVDSRADLYPTGTARTGTPTAYNERVWSQLIDLNGDGLSDFLYYDEVGFNKGTGFKAFEDVMGGPFPSAYSDADVDITGNSGNINVTGTRREFARGGDFNGDGRPDFVNTDTQELFLGMGDGNFLEVSSGSAAYRQYLVNGASGPGWEITEDTVDLDGDGIPDHVTESLGNVVITWTLTDVAPPGVLKSVDNGRGLALDVEYAPHTNSATVSMAGGEQPGTLWVVSKMTGRHLVGGAPDQVTSYHYTKPKRSADDFERIGFRGFDSVMATSPSGAITEERFAYDVDWSGRKTATLTYAAGSSNPTTISTIDWDQFTTLGSIATVHPQMSRSYVCEKEDVAGAPTTLDEASCLLEDPLVTDTAYGYLTSGGDDIAIVAIGSVEMHDDPATSHPNAYWGRCRESENSMLYTATDWRIVATKETMKFGSVIRDDLLLGPELTWDCYGPLASHVETAYDSTLRVAERVCSARVLADVVSGSLDIEEAACAAFDVDVATGLLLREQAAQGFYDDYHNEQSWTTGVTSYDYADPTLPFMVFPTTVTQLRADSADPNLVVTSVTDLGTGVQLSAHGPNTNEGGYQEIDGFGRTLHEWTLVGASDYRRKRDVTYNDFALPQKVTERHTRVLGTEAQLASNHNFWWAQIETTLDGAGRPTQVYEASLSAGEDPSTRTYTYDASGNLATSSVPDPSKPKYQTGDVTYTFSYDSLSRRTCNLAPDGSGVATLHAGRRVKATEFGSDGGDCQNPTEASINSPRSAQWVESDMFGRVVLVQERTDADSDANLATYADTAYEYDGNSNVSKITRIDDNTGGAGTTDIVTDMAHDFVGNRTAILRHGRTWSYTYDRNRSMLSQVSPFSAPAIADDYTISVLYDDLDRPESRVVRDADLKGTPELAQLAVGETEFHYDSGTDGLGRLTQKVTPFATVDYTYDARGNLAKETRDFDLAASGVPDIPLIDNLLARTVFWNSFGQPITRYQPSGRKTTTQYHRWPSVPRYLYLVQDDGWNEYFNNSRNGCWDGGAVAPSQDRAGCRDALRPTNLRHP